MVKNYFEKQTNKVNIIFESDWLRTKQKKKKKHFKSDPPLRKSIDWSLWSINNIHFAKKKKM